MKCQTTLFQDRRDAAIQMQEHLPLDRMKSEEWHLVAVSGGGLEMASHMLGKHVSSLDYLLSEAIYAPQNPECEIARVSETEEIVIHDNLVKSFDVKLDYVYGEASRKHEEKISSAIYKYRKGNRFESQEGRTVLLVDDGSESGLRLLTAVKTILNMNPRAVYIAVPVIPDDVVEVLEPLVDDVYYVHDLEDYIDTACYYNDFGPISDENIASILGG